MSARVTLIVESDHHGGSVNRMDRTIETYGDNPRFYANEMQHVIVELMTWAHDLMVCIVGEENQLADKAKLVVTSCEDLDRLGERSTQLRDLQAGKTVQGVVLVDANVWTRLVQRDALLGRMEAAGVDNWEGMNHLPPEDD